MKKLIGLAIVMAVLVGQVEAGLLCCKKGCRNVEPSAVSAVQEPVVEQVASAPEVQEEVAEEEPDWTVRYWREHFGGRVQYEVNPKWKYEVTQERIDADLKRMEEWYAKWDAMSQEEKDEYNRRWEETTKPVRTVAAVQTEPAEVKPVSNVTVVEDEVVQDRGSKRCCCILRIFKKCR